MEWGIINWKIEDLKSTDRKTRKLLNMHEGLYHSFNKDRLYFQDFGWTRLNIYQEIVHSAGKYIAHSSKRLLKTGEELQLEKKLKTIE